MHPRILLKQIKLLGVTIALTATNIIITITNSIIIIITTYVTPELHISVQNAVRCYVL
jgi:hypothetical protein